MNEESPRKVIKIAREVLADIEKRRPEAIYENEVLLNELLCAIDKYRGYLNEYEKALKMKEEGLFSKERIEGIRTIKVLEPAVKQINRYGDIWRIREKIAEHLDWLSWRMRFDKKDLENQIKKVHRIYYLNFKKSFKM